MDVQQEDGLLDAAAVAMDRSALMFESSALEAFGWLEGLGFCVSERTVTRVGFRGPNIDVWVYHGRSSYEIGVELSRRDTGAVCTMSAIIGVFEPSAEDRYHHPIGLTKESVRKFVLQQSRRLKRLGGPALRGDSAAWASFAAYGEEVMNELALRSRLLPARGLAQKAFRQRDFCKYVELFEPLEEHLTPVEARKLDYARKQCNGVDREPEPNSD